MDLRAALGTESKKDEIQSYNHKEPNSAPNLNECEGPLSSRWECGPANTLISVLWDPEQRTQLSCAHSSNLQKPWDNKRMLFSVTKVGVICYTAIEHWYIHPGASSCHTSFQVGPDTSLFLFSLVLFSFFPTYFLHISPFLPLSSLRHFTDILSSLASSSCFETTVNCSVYPETLSVPQHCDQPGALAAPHRHLHLSASLFSLLVLISTTLPKKHYNEVPNLGDCDILSAVSLEDILGLVCLGVPHGI